VSRAGRAVGITFQLGHGERPADVGVARLVFDREPRRDDIDETAGLVEATPLDHETRDRPMNERAVVVASVDVAKEVCRRRGRGADATLAVGIEELGKKGLHACGCCSVKPHHRAGYGRVGKRPGKVDGKRGGRALGEELVGKRGQGAHRKEMTRLELLEWKDALTLEPPPTV